MSLHLVVADVANLHEMRATCPCGPVIKAQPRPDGTYGRIVDHRGAAAVDETPKVEEQVHG